jgi:hypothetical protein
MRLMLDNPWVALALWLASYFADYYLTLYSARLYRQGAQDHFGFEGSLELTPYYQNDIDRLRRVSLRFLLAVVWSVLLLELIWYLSHNLLYWPPAFEFVLGGLLLREAAVIMRHLRNIGLFRAARHGGVGLEGKVSYSRRLSLSQSALELGSYTLFFAVLAVLTDSWLLAGGALACALTGFQHWRRARKGSEKEAVPKPARS